MPSGNEQAPLSVKRLTIAIPTYGRRDELLPRIRTMMENGTADVAEILVIDDGSHDGTSAALVDAGLDQHIRLVTAETNRGYARTFIDALRHCKTEFALMSADDDDVLPDGVDALAGELEHETAHIIATSYLVQGADDRGITRRGKITPSTLRIALNLAPGVVYRVPTALEHLTHLERRLETGCSMARLYPQVVLGTHVALRHELRWFSVATVSQGANLPTGIRDDAGRAYDSAASRLQQIVDYDELLVDLVRGLTDGGERRYARQLLRHHRRTAFSQLRHHVERRSPALGWNLELGGARSLALRPMRLARDGWRKLKR